MKIFRENVEKSLNICIEILQKSKIFTFFRFSKFSFFSKIFDFAKDFNEKFSNQKNLNKKKCDTKYFFSIAHNFFANEGILDRTKVLESLARDLFKSARNPLEIDLRKS